MQKFTVIFKASNSSWKIKAFGFNSKFRDVLIASEKHLDYKRGYLCIEDPILVSFGIIVCSFLSVIRR